MCHLRHIWNFFFILSHHMTYQICDVVMSISTWDRVHFSIYFLNQNSLSRQTCPIDIYIYIYKQGQQFSGILWSIWVTGAKGPGSTSYLGLHVLFNLATCSSYSITNYVKIPVFYFFEKGKKGLLKKGLVNCNY